MSEDPVQYQRAVDLARATERREQLLNDAGNVAASALPTLGLEIGTALLMALAAALLLRNRRGYLPEWARRLLGVRRVLHSRSELRPKPSPLQPEPWRH
jgi:hypothetical protein